MAARAVSTRRVPPAVPRIAVVLILLGAAAWAGWRWYEQRASAGRLFGSGSLQATQVDVAPKVSGRIIRLFVDEGDQVKAGQRLAELAPQEASAQVAQAEAAVIQATAKVVEAQQAVTAQQQVTDAQVAQAQAQVRAAATAVPQAETSLAMLERTSQEAVTAAQAQLRAARAQTASAKSALAKAAADLRRARELFAQGAVGAQDLDTAQAAYDAAVAADRSAQDAVSQQTANLASARANLMQVDVQRKAVEASRANLAQAQAGLKNAETGYVVLAERRQDLAAARAAQAQAAANLRYLQVIAGHNTIYAPRNAVVQTKYVEEGEVVAAGTPLYTIIDPQDIWLRAYIPEDQIGRVRTGQQVHVTVDSFPRRIFEGRVTEISPHGEFTPGNVQTRGDRVKLVFSVKIQLDNRDNALKPGMPADAEIIVGSQDGRTPQ